MTTHSGSGSSDGSNRWAKAPPGAPIGAQLPPPMFQPPPHEVQHAAHLKLAAIQELGNQGHPPEEYLRRALVLLGVPEDEMRSLSPQTLSELLQALKL